MDCGPLNPANMVHIDQMVKMRNDKAANVSMKRELKQHESGKDRSEMMHCTLELVGFLFLVLLACCAIGLCVTGCIAMLWHLVVLAFTHLKHGREMLSNACDVALFIMKMHWYYRRKTWRLHRTKFLSVLLVVAIANAGSVIRFEARARCRHAVHSGAIERKEWELPMALFRRKRVRYDPFFGVRVGEALRPGPPESGVASALKYA